MRERARRCRRSRDGGWPCERRRDARAERGLRNVSDRCFYRQCARAWVRNRTVLHRTTHASQRTPRVRDRPNPDIVPRHARAPQSLQRTTPHAHDSPPVSSMPRFAFVFSIFGVAVVACGGSSSPTASELTDPAACAGRMDTARVPLSDLRTGCYLGFQGGLYPNGSDSMPLAHRAAGLAAAARIRPLDAEGRPSASGRIALLSIGMSNTTQEFCSDGGLPGSCQTTSFVAQAMADPAVNHTTLVLVNGAAGGRTADAWTSPALADYERIRTSWLAPLGLSERQVQVAWVKVANAQPRRSLPDTAADAYLLVRQLCAIARALKSRYPNLQQVFFTSRIYAGYATSSLNPEPYAYESGFAVKWVVEAQIAEMAGLQ